MSFARKRFKVLYDPKIHGPGKEPFKLSRSKIELFVRCPRCYYLDQRFDVRRPPFPSFTLNNAVDALMKKEFDIHRTKGQPHPLMKRHGIDAVPFADERMEEWRDALRRGIQYLHEPTGFLVRGGIDDVWQSPDGTLIIVDYKATSRKWKLSINSPYQKAYKRQMEVYQWLFRKNDFTVSDMSYFVYVNGKADKEAFNDRLEFDVEIIPYRGNDDWIEGKIGQIYQVLNDQRVPLPSDTCEYCEYRESAGKTLQKRQKELKTTHISKKKEENNGTESLF